MVASLCTTRSLSNLKYRLLLFRLQDGFQNLHILRIKYLDTYLYDITLGEWLSFFNFYKHPHSPQFPSSENANSLNL